MQEKRNGGKGVGEGARKSIIFACLSSLEHLLQTAIAALNVAWVGTTPQERRAGRAHGAYSCAAPRPVPGLDGERALAAFSPAADWWGAV